MDWNEDNFLERLAPQLRREGAAEQGHCPDAATLCAVMEGEAPDTARKTVAEHVAQCPACADLQRRLAVFDQEGPPEPEAVWKETRNRLDHWLEKFLRSEAALGAAQRAKPFGGTLSWENISSRFSSWKVQWALGVAVVLVFIAGAVLLKERQTSAVSIGGSCNPPISPARAATVWRARRGAGKEGCNAFPCYSRGPQSANANFPGCGAIPREFRGCPKPNGPDDGGGAASPTGGTSEWYTSSGNSRTTRRRFCTPCRSSAFASA